MAKSRSAFLPVNLYLSIADHSALLAHNSHRGIQLEPERSMQQVNLPLQTLQLQRYRASACSNQRPASHGWLLERAGITGVRMSPHTFRHTFARAWREIGSWLDSLLWRWLQIKPRKCWLDYESGALASRLVA